MRKVIKSKKLYLKEFFLYLMQLILQINFILGFCVYRSTLYQPLARLGASVVGVDASEENIKIAQAHLIHDQSIKDRVKYVNTTVEEIAQTQAGKFDAVVASEVLEHVADANMLVTSACQLARVRFFLLYISIQAWHFVPTHSYCLKNFII